MRDTFCGRAKSILGAGIAALGIVIFHENLDLAATQLRHLLGPIPREALGIVPTVILAVARVLQASAADRQQFLHDFLRHTLASVWPLLLVVVGAVLSRDACTGNVSASSKKDGGLVDSAAGRSTLE
jgi:hypothetical protein